jgi:hypothetical protein
MVVWRLSRHAGAVSRAVVEAHAGWEGGSRFQSCGVYARWSLGEQLKSVDRDRMLCIFLDGIVGQIELPTCDRASFLRNSCGGRRARLLPPGGNSIRRDL